MYMCMVDQDLPGRGKRNARATVAEKDIELAAADVTIRARQIVNEITQAYCALFIARKATEIHLASVDVLREIADAAQARYTSGRGSQQDLLKPVVELSKLHNDVVMHDQEAGLAMARLNVLLNRPPESPIGPMDEPHEAILLPTSGELQQLAIAHQPELQRARIEIARAEAELASAKLERKPDFNVQGGYQLMPNQTDGLLAKVGITWPNAPWSRGKIDAKVAEQSAAMTTATSRERAMENAVRLAVQEAYVRATAAQARASLLRTTIVPQSRQAFDVSRAAYQADRADFSAILDTERGLLDARLDYFRALADFTQAIADLERAVGTECVSPRRKDSEMKRFFLLFVTVGVLLVVVGAGVFLIRAKRRPGVTPATPAAEPRSTVASDATPRGPIIIDARRQQLIGVRTVPATKTALTPTIRAVGSVRSAETKMADVNVKLDGWIRDLFVDYTGQAVVKGQPLFTLYSPDLLATETEYVLALKARDQLQQSDVADAKTRAEQLVGSARQTAGAGHVLSA